MGCPHLMKRRCSSSSSVVPLLFLVFLLAIFFEKSVGIVSASEYSKDEQDSSLTLENIQKYLAKINKPAVMTLEGPNGETIACVDKWKQPAFDHPLLKNHKLPLVTPELPQGMRIKGVHNISRTEPQVWHQNGKRCPKGTVPIKRITVEDVLRAQSLQDFMSKRPNTALAAFNATFSPNNDVPQDLPHEYSVVNSKPGSPLYGASAAINLWKPRIGNWDEMSISQIWLASGEYDAPDLNTIEAGWMVYPRLYGDNEPRLFVYWTADTYVSTGCYNLMCPGFMQVDENIIVGSILAPPSTIGGKQFEAIIQIWKDEPTGDWWLAYGENGIKVGYWPASLFTRLKESAQEAQWGGEVTNARFGGVHTTTEMGSGLFARAGHTQASYFRDIKVLNSNRETSLAETPMTRVNDANCYSIELGYLEDFMKAYFFYGGPGRNPDCA